MIFYLDVDLAVEIMQLYLIIGLVALLTVLHIGLNNIYERETLEEKLGIIVLTVILFWPYNLICWIFSWSIWLTPMSELFKRK